LRDQQFTDVDAELPRVHGVERILGVDVGRGAAGFLHLRNHLQAERRLAGRFRTVDLDDTTARQATDAERDVETERARRHDREIVLDLGLAHFHDRALAELLLDLRECGGERLALVVVHHQHESLPSVMRGAVVYGELEPIAAAIMARTIVRWKHPNGRFELFRRSQSSERKRGRHRGNLVPGSRQLQPVDQPLERDGN
jgi:hypothetical protein